MTLQRITAVLALLAALAGDEGKALAEFHQELL